MARRSDGGWLQVKNRVSHSIGHLHRRVQSRDGRNEPGIFDPGDDPDIVMDPEESASNIVDDPPDTAAHVILSRTTPSEKGSLRSIMVPSWLAHCRAVSPSDVAHRASTAAHDGFEWTTRQTRRRVFHHWLANSGASG